MILTVVQRIALVDHLCLRFRALIRSKESAVEMEAIAKAFNVARLLGAGVPSEAAFMDTYWTTLGPIIYRPRNAVPTHDNPRPVFHEIGHVVGFWRDPYAFVTRYATQRGRAELEAEAGRSAMEAWYLLTGELPASREALDITRHGYALDSNPGAHDDHADLTRDLLEQALVSVRAGVVSTDVGIEVRDWLARNGITPAVV